MADDTTTTEAPAEDTQATETPTQDTNPADTAPTETADTEAPAEQGATQNTTESTLLSGDNAGDGAPDTIAYEYSVPEGEELSPEETALIDGFKGEAAELGLSQEQFQALIDRQRVRQEEMVQAGADAYAERTKVWAAEAAKDAEIFGGSKDKFNANLEIAKKARDAIASPALKQLLDDPSPENPEGLGLGKHPEIVRTFLRVGLAMQEDSLIIGGATNDTAKSSVEATAEQLYPGLNEKVLGKPNGSAAGN